MSGVDETASNPSTQMVPLAASPGSIYASWAASGPWMANNVPKAVDSLQTGGWKMKVIQSLDKKLKDF